MGGRSGTTCSTQREGSLECCDWHPVYSLTRRHKLRSNFVGNLLETNQEVRNADKLRMFYDNSDICVKQLNWLCQQYAVNVT
jgi:hypothetical protein